MGNIHTKLKQELCNLLGLKNIILFSSCRNALYTLLLHLNLKEGDEVIVQSFICSTLPTAIKEAGGIPILVEVDEETFNLNSQEVEKKITKKTKALIFVHTYGNSTGILEIKKLCKKYNLILIEDVAQSLGASYSGKSVGSFGDYAILSFTKQIINIGGGALMSNLNLSEVRKLRNQLNKKPKFVEYFKRLITSLYEARAFFLSKILINIASKQESLKVALHLDSHFTCSNIEAYLALRQIKFLNEKIIKRKNNYEYLSNKIKTQRIDEKAKSSYTYLTFIFPNREARDRVLSRNFLFLPPWKGSKISEKLIFVPNSPYFTKHRLNSFINTYKTFLN